MPRRRFNTVSLDALNFLFADVRVALGPYLNAFSSPGSTSAARRSDWSRPRAMLTILVGLLRL